ncbi:MAG TPA: hypothetical protein VGJ55_04560 [Pyrinomonadaceae bacterium]|jgi:hypothetical protein
MKLRFSFLALHVLLPVLAGGLIYICWRDPDLFMFRWFGAVGLGTLLNDLRAAVAGAQPSLPRWFLYCLPDGLWVYALTAFMMRVWGGTRSSVLAIGWISLGLVIGAGSELGQLAGIVPGAFDRVDLFFSVFAAGLAIFFTSINSTIKRSFNEASL